MIFRQRTLWCSTSGRDPPLYAPCFFYVWLRRLAPAGFGWHGSNVSEALSGQAEAWNVTFQHRLKGYNFGEPPKSRTRMRLEFQQQVSHLGRISWSNVGASVLKVMEQCRIRRARIRAHSCHSVFACEAEVAGSLNASWVYAKSSWVVVS